MAEQRMVPVELLEEIWRDIGIHTDATCSSIGRGVLNDLRAIIDGPGVEPFAYYVYFPDAQDGEFCDDLDDLIDRMTNERHEVTPLFSASPSAPVARCHECGKLASDMSVQVVFNSCHEESTFAEMLSHKE